MVYEVFRLVQHKSGKRIGDREFMPTKVRRLSTVKHECGHAVVAMFFGGTFKSVEVHSDRPLESEGTNIQRCFSGSSISGIIRGLGHDLDDQEYVIALMAGAAGTKVNRAKPGGFTLLDMLGGCESDWRLAVEVVTPQHIECFARKAKDVQEYLNECHDLAYQIIQRYKAVHSALVEVLFQNGKLSYEECWAIWTEAREMGVSVNGLADLPSPPLVAHRAIHVAAPTSQCKHRGEIHAQYTHLERKELITAIERGLDVSPKLMEATL
jgi:hypothetical protein